MSRLVTVGVLVVAAAGGGGAWYWIDQHRAEQAAAHQQQEAKAQTATYLAEQHGLVAHLQALRLGPTFSPAPAYLGNAGVCAGGSITVGCWHTQLRPPVAARAIAEALRGGGFGSATIRCEARPYCLVHIHDSAANSISYRLIPHAGSTNVWAVASR